MQKGHIMGPRSVDRYEQVVRLRCAGGTFAEIGAVMGMTQQGASHLHNVATRWAEHKKGGGE